MTRWCGRHIQPGDNRVHRRDHGIHPEETINAVLTAVGSIVVAACGVTFYVNGRLVISEAWIRARA